MLGILFAASAIAAPRLVLGGEVGVGVPVAFTLTEDQPGTVIVAGCGAVELERREGEAWVPVAGPRCEAPVPAVTVETRLTLSATVPAPGTWRAVAAWGAGCVPGRPFSLAACRTLDRAVSEPFDAS